MFPSHRVAPAAAFFFLVLWLPGVGATAAAADVSSATAPAQIAAVLARTPPPIDGNVDAPAWQGAARTSFDYDLTYRAKVPQDPTDVYLLVDPRYLYVAFAAKQSEPVLASEHTNDAGEGNDDQVSIDLWPDGPNGFHYTFTSNPIGTHYQSSSENSAFAPQWESAGRIVPGGYQVTMRIPRDVLRTDGEKNWIVQFTRSVVRSNRQYVWSHATAMSFPDQVQFAGRLTGIGVVAPQRAAARPRPRLELYGLGEMAGTSAGGSTSRVGADFSVPLTATTSVFGTLHPDYSEVELDQQTIAPTEFRRRFQEVRPFFTQGAQFFCPPDNGCGQFGGNAQLYTPGIPTPRDGLAVEGTQGQYQFAVLDAMGARRDDNAEVVTYTTPNRRVVLQGQRVEATMPGLADLTQSASVVYDNRSDFDLTANYATDRGTNVLDPQLGNDESFGGDIYGPRSDFNLTWSSQGLYYNPFDGYVQNTDVRGWSSNVDHRWEFSPQAPLQSIHVDANVDRYDNHLGALAQADNGLSVDLHTRGKMHIGLSTGSSYLLVAGYGLVPYNQNSIEVGFERNPSTPSSISYSVGHYYDGFLQTLDLQTALRVHGRGVLSLERYQTNYASPTVHNLFQALDRASFTYQISNRASFSVGWRFIGGVAPVQAGPAFGRATNLSFAYTLRMPHDNLYVVYGDPNQVATVGQFIVKLVHFIGAGQGV